MSLLDVALLADNGTPAGSARAEVTRFTPASRTWRAAGIVVAGIGFGGLSILAPGLHLVLTWLAPAVGAALGLTVARMRAWVGSVRATCPSCHHDLHVRGPGPVFAAPAPVTCPHCGAAWTIRITA